MSSNFSRRQLFKLRLGDVGNLVRQARQSLVEKNTEDESPAAESPAENINIIRPPGALSPDSDFLATCERCHACADACPHEGVIQTFGPSHGANEGSPFLTPGEAPCRWCFDTPCISACPSDALQIPKTDSHEAKPLAAIAAAVLDLDSCLNNQGTICDTCALMCPPHIKAIKMISRQPHIDVELCTGCGMCAYYCESEPGSITIVPLS
ncbi:MAG: hypothetical protein QM496_03770 [Verrucomicrobiota bacterium]